MPITVYSGDASRWEKNHRGEVHFCFSEGKAILCREIESQEKRHILLYSGDILQINNVGTGTQNIEFTKGGIRYEVDEIILKGEKIYTGKDESVVYRGKYRIENFLPSWFEKNK